MTNTATATCGRPSRSANLRRTPLTATPAVAGAPSIPSRAHQQERQPTCIDASARKSSPHQGARAWKAKLAVLSVVAAAILVGPAASPAQAVTVTSHWYGWSVNLNRVDTDIVASSSIIGTAAYLSARVNHPVIKGAIAGGAALIIGWARAARYWGKCLAFKVPRFGPVTVTPWIQGC